MPYIPQRDRPPYEQALFALMKELRRASVCAIKGHLCYVVASLGARVITDRAGDWREKSDIINAIEEAAAELRRRVLAPHEDDACAKNGDIL